MFREGHGRIESYTRLPSLMTPDALPLAPLMEVAQDTEECVKAASLQAAAEATIDAAQVLEAKGQSEFAAVALDNAEEISTRCEEIVKRDYTAHPDFIRRFFEGRYTATMLPLYKRSGALQPGGMTEDDEVKITIYSTMQREVVNHAIDWSQPKTNREIAHIGVARGRSFVLQALNRLHTRTDKPGPWVALPANLRESSRDLTPEGEKFNAFDVRLLLQGGSFIPIRIRPYGEYSKGADPRIAQVFLNDICGDGLGLRHLMGIMADEVDGKPIDAEKQNLLVHATQLLLRKVANGAPVHNGPETSQTALRATLAFKKLVRQTITP
jgi:hypothetical protein